MRLSKDGIVFGICLNNKKFFISIVCVLLMVLLLYVLYMVVLQPVLAPLYDPLENSGVDLYNQNLYIDFDGGTDFQSCISELDFIEKSNISNFTFVDNYFADNWIYNYICTDFFLLECEIDFSQYDDVLKEIEEKGLFYSTVENRSYYYMDKITIPSDNKALLVAFNEENTKITIIMITNLKSDSARHDLISLLYMNGSDILFE